MADYTPLLVLGGLFAAAALIGRARGRDEERNPEFFTDEHGVHPIRHPHGDDQHESSGGPYSERVRAQKDRGTPATEKANRARRIPGRLFAPFGTSNNVGLRRLAPGSADHQLDITPGRRQSGSPWINLSVRDLDGTHPDKTIEFGYNEREKRWARGVEPPPAVVDAARREGWLP